MNKQTESLTDSQNGHQAQTAQPPRNCRLSSTLLFWIGGIAMAFLIGIYVGRNTVDSALKIRTSNSYVSQADERLSPAKPTAAVRADTKKININTATVAELTALPGIGEAMAQRIVDYRAQNGSFADIDLLLKVSGIGEARLDKIREFITLEDE